MKRFGKWYEKNREEHNAKRRERYRNDPAYRQKQIEAHRRWRRAAPTRRSGNGWFGISTLAHELGVSVQTIRRWETVGYLPCKPNILRQYTNANLELARRLVEFFKNNKRSSKGYFEALRAVVDGIHKEWVFYGSDIPEEV